MADKGKNEAAAPVQSTTKYPIEKLAAYCRKLFGVSSSTFAGATYGLTGAYSVEEIKDRINKWSKEEAK